MIFPPSRTPRALFIGTGMSAVGHQRKSETASLMSALPPRTDIMWRAGHVRFVPCVDGSVLARVFLNDIARLVGAAMCSAC